MEIDKRKLNRMENNRDLLFVRINERSNETVAGKLICKIIMETKNPDKKLGDLNPPHIDGDKYIRILTIIIRNLYIIIKIHIN